ncbi:MAG: Gfo/Idh/MocA family oxidoreductase [Pirellulaceae bacterium]
MNSKSNKGSTRREFVKRSGTVVAASTAIGMVGAPSTVRAAAHVAGSDTMRIGLIGCGGRGTGAAQQAMNTESGKVELVAAGDAFENRLNQAIDGCKRHKEDHVSVNDNSKFVGFDAYKRVLDQELDLVILATPPAFRPMHFEAAIDAGKHVFMEKPVAVDAPGVRRILRSTEIASKKGLAVGVGLQRRHERAYREVIGELQNGAIGDFIFAKVYWNMGSLWVNPKQEGQTELEYQLRNWLYFTWLSGDHIVEQHIHNMDVINWLMNGYPVKANGMGGRQVRVGARHGEIFDHHAVEFEYESGLIMSSQCRQIPDCWNSVSEHVYGTKGYSDISAGVIYDHDGNEVFKTNGSRGGHQQEHHDLFADLQNGELPNEGEYGAKSTMTAILGRLCTYTGKEIKWEDAINSEVSLCDVDSIKSIDDMAPVQPLESGEYAYAMPGSNIEKYIDF